MYCKDCGNWSGNNDYCESCSQKRGVVYNRSDEANAPNMNMGQGYGDVSYGGRGVKWLSAQRVLGFVAVALFVFGCCMPMFSDAVDFSASLLKLAMYSEGYYFIFIIPFFMFLNVCFDRYVMALGMGGLKGGFFRFKLCILWGLIGIVALVAMPYVMSRGLGLVSLNYEIGWFVALCGCVLAIIVPFTVRMGDGTGLKPVKALDSIWIVICGVLAVFLCYSVVTTGSVNSGEEYAYSDYGYEEDYGYNSDYNEYAEPEAPANEYGYAEPEAPAVEEPIYNREYQDGAGYEEPESYWIPVENFMNEFGNAMVNAINSGDYSIVENYIAYNSDFEASQRSLVDRLYSKGTRERFDGISLTFLENNGMYTEFYAYVSEAETIYYSDGTSEAKTYSWMYTIEYDGVNMVISNIEQV